MKKTKKNPQVTMPAMLVFACACMGLVLAGCDTLRFAPSEVQKQNAWLHNRQIGKCFASIASLDPTRRKTKSGLHGLLRLAKRISTGRDG